MSAICLLLVLSAARTASGWGGYQHMQINRAAARAVPDEMASWRKYARILAELSYEPDLWKSDDPHEAARHYVDLELWGWPSNALPRNLPDLPMNELEARGLAPWAIVEAQERLSDAMRSNDWEMATRVAAALGHYVADTHQPLHCTVNFNGQLTGDHGVHLRWEMDMPKHVLADPFATYEPTCAHIGDTWAAVTGWVAHAHARHTEILEADREARWQAQYDVTSDAYLRALWERTGDLFNDQAQKAATDLAGIWYNAWLNAGSPPIPSEPPKEISHATFYAPVWAPESEPASPRAFLIILSATLLLVVGLSLIQQRAAGKKPSS